MELPDIASRAELVRRYAHLLSHFGSEIGERPLVRQNGKFFPDVFEKDAASVERLVRRIQAHAGLSDIPLEVRLVSLEPSEMSGGGCGTGGCGSGSCNTSTSDRSASPGEGNGAGPVRLEERNGGWVLNVFDAELHHPVALTCSLARALARLFLHETESAETPVEAPLDVSVDLACVALGLGMLVLEGSFIYAKSCGGPSVTQLTKLSVGELAVACSLFIARGGHSGRRALTELGTTQRALLAEANEWAASNPRIIEQLSNDPGQLALRAPELGDTRPWLLRLFDRQPKRAEASLERALSADVGDDELLALARAARNDGAEGRASRAPSDPRRDELRALVDEALRSS
ncbi:MAG TPA: hypothetical protein VMG12_19820 [Polyangiaceae bacterium]|nr:hypothetical protein [Polyangiaceae bacterium]